MKRSTFNALHMYKTLGAAAMFVVGGFLVGSERATPAVAALLMLPAAWHVGRTSSLSEEVAWNTREIRAGRMIE